MFRIILKNSFLGPLLQEFFESDSSESLEKESSSEDEDEEEVSDEELLRRLEQDSKIRGDYELTNPDLDIEDQDSEEDYDPPSGSGLRPGLKKRSSYVKKAEGWEENEEEPANLGLGLNTSAYAKGEE